MKKRIAIGLLGLGCLCGGCSMTYPINAATILMFMKNDQTPTRQVTPDHLDNPSQTDAPEKSMHAHEPTDAAA